jgi:type I restriction enzyme S subunit
MKTSWPKIKLGELDISYFKGISVKEKGQEGDAVLVPSAAVFPAGINFGRTKRFLSSNYNIKGKILQDGDFLLNCGGVGTLGRSSIFHYNSSTDKAVPDSFVLVIRSKNTNVLNSYIFYFFQTEFIKNIIIENTRGTTGITSIRTESILEFPLPIPSILEQQRIVGILDEAFEGIGTAKTNAEKNLSNARALFESHLQSVFTLRGKGWVVKPLGNLASFRNGINYTKDSKGECIKIVGVRNFQKNFYAPLDDLDAVTIDGELSELDSLRKDDILAVRSNGNIELIGRCVLAGEVTEKISHSGFTIRIRLSNGEVLPRYLCHFMKSSSSRKQLTDGGTGTNIKSLNQGMLSALVIPFPPISVQIVLVEKLESLSEETQRLESLYQRKLAALETLKKSLLRQAFTGQL